MLVPRVAAVPQGRGFATTAGVRPDRTANYGRERLTIATPAGTLAPPRSLAFHSAVIYFSPFAGEVAERLKATVC